MTERPNKELALRYWNNPTLRVWWWNKDRQIWIYEPIPNFREDFTYYVGHEAPTEPPVKMCELAGIRFPMPMREAPKKGTNYWTPIAGVELWVDHKLDKQWLEMGLCQATSEGAIAQGRAMAAALLQAIEGAK